MSLTLGSLFSGGVDGLSLGIERATGAELLWQVEIDEWCRLNLARHWPSADRSVVDVRKAGSHNLARVDILCGGSPCQDLSIAGRGAGLAGARSGLWFEMLRIAGELRPRFVVLENVSALATRGLDVVIGGLSASGYDALWFPLRASDLGSPQQRERLFIVAELANAGRDGGKRLGESGIVACAPSAAQGEGDERERCGHPAGAGGQDVADADRLRCEGHRSPIRGRTQQPWTGGASGGGPEPRLGGSPHGSAHWLDRWPARPGEAQHDWEPPRTIERAKSQTRRRRLKALGNAVVPQCAEVIGRIVAEMAGVA